MIRSARQVFVKDGRELLRDRRTIFVNVVLPVLLYPVLGLFAIQAMQLLRTEAGDVPRVAALGVDADLADLLAAAAVDGTGGGEAESDLAAEAETGPPSKVGFRIAEPEADLRERLAQAVAELAAQQNALAEDEPGTDAEREGLARARSKVRDLLRAHGLAGVVLAQEPVPIVTPDAGSAANDSQGEREAAAGSPEPARLPPRRLVVVYDEAHRYHPQLVGHLTAVLAEYEQLAIAERLRERELPPNLAEPVTTTTLGVAAGGEAIRVRIAGIIPLLLVFMALSGAFYPALDLIAGERERGTLESLLAWPGDRRGIFCGKLLVVIAAALVSVILNLASLGLTVIIFGTQAGGEQAAGLIEGIALGADMLVLCALSLLPVCVTLAAISLALAGFAASFKEAQNYLSPLIIAVVAPAAMVLLVPAAKPTMIFDLVPVIGPLLALKESLQATDGVPWGHLALSLLASTATAAVVVAWSVRLLDQESFLYPGLVRAGWGRFRRWGRGPDAPGGLEALALFAVALAAFMISGTLVQDAHPVAMTVVPLIAGIALPAIFFLWLGAYPLRVAAAWRPPRHRWWPRSVILIGVAVVLSWALGQLQQPVLGPMPDTGARLERIVNEIEALGGVPLLVLCLAVVPGICEELLFRGPILSGLRRGIGIGGGIAVSALLFAALHASPWRFAPQLVLGAILGLLVWRSGSVWTAMLVHTGHNALLLILVTVLDESDVPELPLWGLVLVAASSLAAASWLAIGGRAASVDAAAESDGDESRHSAGQSRDQA